jgi:hypothetical protein
MDLRISRHSCFCDILMCGYKMTAKRRVRHSDIKSRRLQQGEEPMKPSNEASYKTGYTYADWLINSAWAASFHPMPADYDQAFSVECHGAWISMHNSSFTPTPDTDSLETIHVIFYYNGAIDS